MADNNDLQLVTGKVRLSYAHLFEPYANDADQEPRYSVMLLIPKDDEETLGKIERAIEAAKQQGKSSKWNGKIPHNLKLTLRDGDEEYDTDERPEMAGMMFMNVSSKKKPGLVDQGRREITDPMDLYSGCYARVQLGCFPFNGKSNGVSFGLNHVQKWADGEPLGGSNTKAEDVFGDIELTGEDLL